MPHTKESVDRVIRANLKAIEKAIDAGAKSFVAAVDRLRQDVILAIVEVGEINPATSALVRERIAVILERYRELFAAELSENQRRLFIRGLRILDEAVNEAVEKAERLAVPFLSEEKRAVLQRYSADLITGLTDYARDRIRQELDLASLGQKPTADVIKEIGRNLKSKSIFRSIAKRAEIIHRTETNRVASIALTERLRQAGPQVPDLRKEWVHGKVGVPRAGHLELSGTVVGFDEKFELKGEDGETYFVDGPFDPILPAGETVNCRCKIVPVVGRFEK